MILTKQIVRFGNSAGVVLPREWLNGIARVQLVEKPIDIKKDVLEILDYYLKDVLGVYIAGSYARGEQTKESDVDILVITSRTNKRIERGRYNIIMIDRDKLRYAMKKVVLPWVPMIKEAKVLINEDLIEEIRKEVEITKDNVRIIVELARSALGVNRAFLNIDKDWPSNVSDSTAYSLILNIRSLYLIDCLKKNRMWNNREFKLIIKRISGSLKAYEGYLRVKNDDKILEVLPLNEAEKIYKYLESQIEEAEKWLKGKKY